MSLRKNVVSLEKEIKKRFVGNDEEIHIAILNLLHPYSTLLIRAPRGLGKSTLMLLLLKGIFGDDFVVISGASEVKRGEVIGRLHIPSLEKKGIEKVVWSAFVKTPGKGIDEVNRLNPYTTANIYHMLQFGEVWAYGERRKTEDFILISNENPSDPTTFKHPPPFYDRFDIVIYLKSLTLSEKFELQSLLKKYGGDLIRTMPQTISFDEIKEIREEINDVEIDVELKGIINMLVRDLQVCIRNRDFSMIKPLALCEGCHFIRDICSMIRIGPSERATVILSYLVRAMIWLDGKCEPSDVVNLGKWVFPHRIELVKERYLLEDIIEILNREKIKMREREIRKEWFILNELYKGFSRELYRKAKEISLEDQVFAEELMKLEKKWVDKGVISFEETISAYFK